MCLGVYVGVRMEDVRLLIGNLKRVLVQNFLYMKSPKGKKKKAYKFEDGIGVYSNICSVLSDLWRGRDKLCCCSRTKNIECNEQCSPEILFLLKCFLLTEKEGCDISSVSDKVIHSHSCPEKRFLFYEKYGTLLATMSKVEKRESCWYLKCCVGATFGRRVTSNKENTMFDKRREQRLT